MSEHRPFEVGDKVVIGNIVAELVHYDPSPQRDTLKYRTADNNTHTAHVSNTPMRHLEPTLHEESAASVDEATQAPAAVEDRMAKARAAKAAKAAAGNAES